MKNNLKPVVVYVTEETLQLIDTRVKVLRILEAGKEEPQEVSRTSVVREVVEELAARTPQDLLNLQVAVLEAGEALRS